MSSEMSSKLQTLLWWITSIAVSVLCCSILFVLFASYMVDMKATVKESDMRITIIEEREDRILAEVQALRHQTLQTVPPAAPTAETPAAPAAESTPAVPIITPPPAPEVAPTPAPTTVTTPIPPATVPTPGK